jgi:5-methylcytosine-specific restriction endonuclease McrA
MPTDMRRYPSNWKEIRAAILERAGHRCERCGIENYMYRFRWNDQDGPGETWHRHMAAAPGLWAGWDDVVDGELVNERFYDRRPARVVLTIAHISDPDPMSCDPANLQALCQACHNQLDAPMRAKHAAETRRRKAQAATGQQEFDL